MIPWPVALLALFYGIVAALSAAAFWRVLLDSLDRSLVWPAAWLLLSAAAMIGLPLLKPWARVVAVAGLVWMMVNSLVLAGGLIAAGHPVGGLCVTLASGVLVIAVRYWRRPNVKAWFVTGER